MQSPGYVVVLDERLHEHRIIPVDGRAALTPDDSATWTHPWTFAMTGKRDPAYWSVFEYACHETNYGLNNILSVTRNLGKAAR